MYIVLRGLEKADFREDFDADALKILESIGFSVDLTLTAEDSLVTTMVSYANHNNLTWPFVTIPDFELRSAKIRSLAKGVWLNFYLRVTNEQRAKWERYTAENKGWIDESVDVMESDPNYHGPIVRNYTTIDYIHGLH